MDKFTASNGAQIVLMNAWQTGYVLVEQADDVASAYLGFEEMVAWREFFQAERDEELGRWRWPENPDYVVYRTDENSILVLRESVGDSEEFQTAWAWCGTGDEPPVTEWQRAAADWAKSHPERKPWHSAEAGEIWVLSIDESEDIPCIVTPYGPDFEPISHPAWATFARGSDRITAARRIYPEVSDADR